MKTFAVILTLFFLIFPPCKVSDKSESTNKKIMSYTECEEKQLELEQKHNQFAGSLLSLADSLVNIINRHILAVWVDSNHVTVIVYRIKYYPNSNPIFPINIDTLNMLNTSIYKLVKNECRLEREIGYRLDNG